VQPKTVLITGCSSGIGRATALAFADEGWTVYATARDPADIETLGEAGCKTDRLDVTDQDDIDRVVDRILDEEGVISCLVNNAGFGQFGPVEDVPIEQVETQYEVNVYGPHRLIRAVLPHMRREEDGTIINVSSVAGRVAFPGGGTYCGSKFALEAMSDALRGEVDPFGIDVVVIEPGPVQTNFSDRAGEEVDTNDRSEAYDDFYGIFDDTEAVGGDGPGSVPPQRVAEDIVNAASATKPVERVPVGTVARVSVLARFIPDTLRDQLWSLVRRFT
jgi:NAD(P)-dependent dehydrogenase (short-subunit alcohol dehydrogenase family)